MTVMAAAVGFNGTVCSEQEFVLSIVGPSNPYPNISCLTRGQSIALAFLSEAGCLSFAAVLVIYGLIIRNILRHRKYGKWKLLRQPADIYVLSLITLDVVQAWGQILSARWAVLGKVFSGNYCTAQGLIQQFGETGVAVTSLTITLTTFLNVFWRIGVHNRKIAFTIVGLTWLFSILWVTIGGSVYNDPEAPYINPTPYWCWINARYFNERVGGEYLWLWTALLASILVYVPIFLWSEGNLSVDAKCWWRFHLHRTSPKLDVRGRRRRAFTILAYPAAYSIVVLPVSVIRFAGFALEAHGLEVPELATFISITLFALSGAMNVLLLVTTRPNLLLFGRPLGMEDEEESMGFLGSLISQITITQERIVAEHPSELSLPMDAAGKQLAQHDDDRSESSSDSGHSSSSSTMGSIYAQWLAN